MNKTNLPSEPDWFLWRSFLAVMDEGSLSAAARALGASQPTIGRHIEELESRLNAVLFDRTGRGLNPTSIAHQLVDPVRHAKASLAEAQLAVTGATEVLEGTVRITAPVGVSLWLLPPIIADMRKAAPEIQIELVPNDASDNLRSREADIAGRMDRPAQLDLVARQLGEMRLGLYGARHFVESREMPQDVEGLLELGMVGHDREERIILGLREQGFAVDRHSFATRCDDQGVYWELVRAGCGLGFAPCRKGDADPDMVCLMRGPPVPSLPMWLAAHEEMRQTPRVARVWDMLAEALPPLLDPVGATA